MNYIDYLLRWERSDSDIVFNVIVGIVFRDLSVSRDEYITAFISFNRALWGSTTFMNTIKSNLPVRIISEHEPASLSPGDTISVGISVEILTQVFWRD